MGTSKRMQRLERNRRKRRNINRYAPKPKLFWIDRLIYWILILLPVIIFVGMLIGIVKNRNDLYEYDNLLAVNFISAELTVVIFILCMIACIIPIGALRAKQPIFGIPGLAYGREGRMRPDHVPLFYKRFPRSSGYLRLLYALGAGVIVLCLVASLIMVPGAVRRRWEIYDTHLQYVDSGNEVEKTLAWSEINGYVLATKRSGGKHVSYYVSVEFDTKDGERLSFTLSSFRDLDVFLWVDGKITSGGIPRQTNFVEKYWNAMVKRGSYPDETMNTLAKLFRLQ